MVQNNTGSSILNNPKEYPYEYTESNGWFHQQIKEIEAAEETERSHAFNQKEIKAQCQRQKQDDIEEIKAQCQRQKQDDIEEERK